jgi:hypothetical protein
MRRTARGTVATNPGLKIGAPGEGAFPIVGIGASAGGLEAITKFLEHLLGRPHQRAKFSWDGREFILSMSIADVPNKNANASWVHDADFSLPNGHGLYEEIASQTSSTLAI